MTEDGRAEGGPKATTAAVDGGATENPKFKWYVVHTYSGHENKARLSLQARGVDEMDRGIRAFAHVARAEELVDRDEARGSFAFGTRRIA